MKVEWIQWSAAFLLEKDEKKEKKISVYFTYPVKHDDI